MNCINLDCNSTNVRFDDDRDPESGEQLNAWWECEDCGEQWTHRPQATALDTDKCEECGGTGISTPNAEGERNCTVCFGFGSAVMASMKQEIDIMREDVKRSWYLARDSGSQKQAFRILEAMVQRVGYGRDLEEPKCECGEILRLESEVLEKCCTECKEQHLIEKQRMKCGEV